MAEYDRSQLTVSWRDSAWIPFLSAANALEYFSQETNPFYDRKCNNEMIKMQRLDPSQLAAMTGLEYTLLHEQGPALYIIRKQHRHSTTQVTPLADYYILMGTVYQAPDLCAIINSRLTTVLCRLQSAFDESVAKAVQQPSKEADGKGRLSGKDAVLDDARQRASGFQRRRVDPLLAKLKEIFPPKVMDAGGSKPVAAAATSGSNKAGSESNKGNSFNGLKGREQLGPLAKKRKEIE
eukprot:m.143046 g.143046  ORF g.143046 m.143046 type:complete len:237 (+) comp38376_c0_seq4:437-1147(+)